jgi:hypothetical protein
MLKHLTLFSSAIVALVLVNVGTVAATQSTSSPVAQSYSEASTVLPGMLVQLSGSTKSVEPLTEKSVSKMLGVVVPYADTPIVLSNTSSAGQQALVATSGKYNVLVSDENGPILSGDRLAMSSIAGIAMKASKTQLQVIGQAEASFNGVNNSLGSETLKNSQGKELTENIGSISTDVDLAINPSYVSNSSILPSFAIKDASLVAGKPVTTLRIVLAAVILIVSLIFTSSLMYGGARSRITAIGRNPLAKSSIGKGVIALVGSGLAVFVLGIIISYLFLKI